MNCSHGDVSVEAVTSCTRTVAMCRETWAQLYGCLGLTTIGKCQVDDLVSNLNWTVEELHAQAKSRL